jgi:hypothetical protein
MKTTNKTTPPQQKHTPTESKAATPDTPPPSDSENIDSGTSQETIRITEVSKPVVEIIACFANCAGFANAFLEEGELFCPHRIEYIFDLKDNRTGRIYKSLFAKKDHDRWEFAFLYYFNVDSGLPLLRALEVKQPSPKEYYADIAGYEDIIIAELNRWSRNLFAMVDYERELDDGFDEYVEMLTELVEEHDEYIAKGVDHNNADDGYAKFLRFPLRP